MEIYGRRGGKLIVLYQVIYQDLLLGSGLQEIEGKGLMLPHIRE